MARCSKQQQQQPTRQLKSQAIDDLIMGVSPRPLTKRHQKISKDINRVIISQLELTTNSLYRPIVVVSSPNEVSNVSTTQTKLISSVISLASFKEERPSSTVATG